MVAKRAHELSIGERVRVPWGLDTLDGEVVDLYGSGLKRQVVVRVHFPDEPSGPEPVTITLPLDVVLEESHRQQPEPGSWVQDVRYQRRLEEALTKILEKLHLEAQLQRPVDARAPDFLIQSGPKSILIEAKTGEVGPQQVQGAIRQLRQYARQLATHGKAAGLVVTDQDIDASLRETSVERPGATVPMALVRWRDSKDNPELLRSLQALLAAK